MRFRIVELKVCFVFFYFGIKETTQRFEFAAAFNRHDFIDNSVFIRDMFNIEGNCYLSMPRGLGKTTILDMVKTFLQVEVDSRGDPLASLEEPVYDTRNYEFFAEKNLEVLKANETMQEHLGRHPVVHAEFKSLGVKTYNDVLDVCRLAVHRSFMEHKYLQNSKQLTEEEQDSVKRLCDDKRYKNLSEVEIIHSLRNLTEFLFSHFDRKVFVLIDDDDDPVIKAFEGLDDGWKVEETLELMAHIIISVVKDNKCLEQALVVGIHSCFERTDYKNYTALDSMRYQRQVEPLFNWKPMTISLQFIG